MRIQRSPRPLGPKPTRGGPNERSLQTHRPFSQRQLLGHRDLARPASLVCRRLAWPPTSVLAPLDGLSHCTLRGRTSALHRQVLCNEDTAAFSEKLKHRCVQEPADGVKGFMESVCLGYFKRWKVAWFCVVWGKCHCARKKTQRARADLAMTR